MIHFEQVSKIFQGKPAVDDLTLHIAEGEFTVLIGTSGSGKSTTLKMINRLIEHDRGKILFAGEEIQSFKPQDLRRRMAMRSSRSACSRTGRWRRTSPPCRSC